MERGGAGKVSEPVRWEWESGRGGASWGGLVSVRLNRHWLEVARGTHL